MDNFIFSHREINDVTGAVETWYYNPDTQGWKIKTTHQIGDILKQNQAQANASVHQLRYGKEMLHHVAEIPNGVITKLMREEGVNVFSNDPEQVKKLRRLLDSPDYRYLKSTVKMLSRRGAGR